jgi:hypothetical protein
MAKSDPKVGTGKKPKGSGRRLYTDENPKDTVSIKYATVQDARDTVAKVNKDLSMEASLGKQKYLEEAKMRLEENMVE